MATRLCSTVRNSNFLSFSTLAKIINYVAPAIATQKTRNLYSKSSLGLEGFQMHKERTQNQMMNVAEKFKEKMREFSQEESKSMIFTEDLKNMIHLSNSDEDIDLVINMIKKFNQQNKQLRFGNFIFGPIVMRLLHHLNKPDVALECFNSPELSGFFDQLTSYQIMLDLLFENAKYQEILDALPVIKDRQIDGTKYPKNVVTLVYAACYKINSAESYEYGVNFWQELKEVGHFPTRRATTFFAGLALTQGHPNVAMEVLTSARNQNYTTIRNIKVAALADLGRVEDAIPILKSVINEDIANPTMLHTFNKDIFERVKNAVAQLDSPEVSVEFGRLEQMSQKQGQICDTTLDEQLCKEIQKPALLDSRQYTMQQYREPRQYRESRNFRPTSRFGLYQRRPGLSELQ